jgi:hypothetical protein
LVFENGTSVLSQSIRKWQAAAGLIGIAVSYVNYIDELSFLRRDAAASGAAGAAQRVRRDLELSERVIAHISLLGPGLT